MNKINKQMRINFRKSVEKRVQENHQNGWVYWQVGSEMKNMSGTYFIDDPLNQNKADQQANIVKGKVAARTF